jgi:hypothetical protein
MCAVMLDTPKSSWFEYRINSCTYVVYLKHSRKSSQKSFNPMQVLWRSVRTYAYSVVLHERGGLDRVGLGRRFRLGSSPSSLPAPVARTNKYKVIPATNVVVASAPVTLKGRLSVRQVISTTVTFYKTQGFCQGIVATANRPSHPPPWLTR